MGQLPNEESYNLCKFDAPGTQKRSSASASASYSFNCDDVGTYYFACSVLDACSTGHQKVRIYVSDPEKTAMLRARGAKSLEQFNREYTLIFAGYYLNKQSLNSVSADQAI